MSRRIYGMAGSVVSTTEHQTLRNKTLDEPTVTGFVHGSPPPGTVVMYAAGTAPAGWALCDGSSYDGTAANYKALFDVVGTSFGGTGTTFQVPDLRDRFVVGAGTTYANGVKGGSKTHHHPLSGANASALVMIETDQIVVGATSAVGVSSPDFTATATGWNRSTGGTAATSAAAVVGQTDDNDGTTTGQVALPPYFALTFIIKL